jgi:hypothetical protein
MPTHRHPYSLIASILTLASLTLPAPAWAGYNYLYGIRGQVFYGRFLIRPDRASEGIVLDTSYQIRINPNSGVNLYCSNSVTYPLGPGTYAVKDYCLDSSKSLSGLRNPTREIFDVNLPYIVSPRNTALLSSDRLTMAWHPVANAGQYQVSLKGQGVNWQATTDQPQVIYDGPPLQSDYRYELIVTSGSGLSSKTGLTLLSEIEVARVQDQVRTVMESGYQPDVEAIALALVYSGYQHPDPDRRSYALNQLAIEALQPPIDANTNNSQVYLLQADIYLTIGLPLVAQERYGQAFTQAEASDLHEQMAQSHEGLAVIAKSLAENTSARRHWQLAQEIYQTLGDTPRVQDIQAQLDRLP